MGWGCGWDLEARRSWLYQAKSATAIRSIERTDRGTDRAGVWGHGNPRVGSRASNESCATSPLTPPCISHESIACRRVRPAHHAGRRPPRGRRRRPTRDLEVNRRRLGTPSVHPEPQARPAPLLPSVGGRDLAHGRRSGAERLASGVSGCARPLSLVCRELLQTSEWTRHVHVEPIPLPFGVERNVV